MNRYWTQRIAASVLLLQSAGVAHAETITVSPYTNGAELFAEAAQSSFEGMARIGDITRQAGGALYKLDLAKAVPLTHLKVKPKEGRVKIISAVLVTEKKERIPVKAFTNVLVSSADQPLSSETFTSETGVSVIEIQAEAMGGKATLDLNAVSSKEAPKLSLREEAVCKSKMDPVLKEKLDTVQVWAGRAEASAPGSIQEKYAIKEFNRYVTEFITTLKTESASYASTEYMVTLLNFFTERHNSSRAGSAAEVAYKNMATETFTVFLASLQSDQPCQIVTSDGMIKIALDFQKRHEASKPDSRGRQLYETMIVGLGKMIPAQYRKEIAGKNYSFRQADTEAHKNYKLFTASKAESFLKASYQEMSMHAYTLAEQALVREVKAMDSEKRYELIVEYQAKYNDAANFPQETMMKYLLILSESGTLFRIYK